jgi:hypothetical protein
MLVDGLNCVIGGASDRDRLAESTKRRAVEVERDPPSNSNWAIAAQDNGDANNGATIVPKEELAPDRLDQNHKIPESPTALAIKNTINKEVRVVYLTALDFGVGLREPVVPNHPLPASVP